MSSNFPKEVQWLCSFMIRKYVHYLYICSAKKNIPLLCTRIMCFIFGVFRSDKPNSCIYKF